jgi:predicted Holliday junction resolvase-like endonuclease
MAKIDLESHLDALGIDELVKLRETVNAKLQEKVANRQLELEAELQRLSEFGKPVKKAAAPAPKARKSEEQRAEEPRDAEPPAADAAEAA